MFISSNINSDILDTLKASPSGFTYKEVHALRTYEAYQLHNKTFSMDQVLDAYNSLEKEVLKVLTTDLVVRAVFSKAELNCIFTTADYVPLKAAVKLQVIPGLKQPSGIGPQNFKWSDRSYWNQIINLKSLAADDVISLNERNQLVETSRFNLFFYDASKNEVITPSLSSGCVNGVYRRSVLRQGFIQLPDIGIKRLKEAEVLIDAVNDYQLFVANSVRELLPAELIS